jgi:hypothetical protein
MIFVILENDKEVDERIRNKDIKEKAENQEKKSGYGLIISNAKEFRNASRKENKLYVFAHGSSDQVGRFRDAKKLLDHIVDTLKPFSLQNNHNRIEQITFFACNAAPMATRVADILGMVGNQNNTDYFTAWGSKMNLKIQGLNGYGTISPKGKIRVAESEEDVEEIEKGWKDHNPERTKKILDKFAMAEGAGIITRKVFGFNATYQVT